MSYMALVQYVREGDGVHLRGYGWSTVLTKQFNSSRRYYRLYLSNGVYVDCRITEVVELNEGGIPVVGGPNPT